MAKTGTNLTIVDPSVVQILTTPDDTASRRDGIDAETERLYRMNGTSLIWSASTLMNLGPSTYASACCMFHRFYHESSLKQYDVWSTAMACVILAGKIEEDPRPLRQVIVVFAHLYRRRRLICCQDNRLASEIADHPRVLSADRAKTTDLEGKKSVLRIVQPLSPLGPIYELWHKAATDTENAVLRQLGFMLYWIPDSHPHKFILYFVRILKIDNKAFTQVAWNCCNDSCRLDFCTRYRPEMIACAAICTAASVCGVALPDENWWESFVGKDSNAGQDLSNICNGLAGLHEYDNKHVSIGSHALLAPLGDSAFNDKDSFLWVRSD